MPAHWASSSILAVSSASSVEPNLTTVVVAVGYGDDGKKWFITLSETPGVHLGERKATSEISTKNANKGGICGINMEASLPRLLIRLLIQNKLIDNSLLQFH